MSNNLIFKALSAGCLLFIAASCNKDKHRGCDISPATNTDSTSISGVWELQVAHGGQGNNEFYADCNGYRYVFTEDHRYSRYAHWEFDKGGTYELITDSVYILHAKGTRIIMDHDTISPRNFLTNTGTKLTIYMDAMDGPGATYTRRREMETL